jgi:hypothetical protein
LDWQSSKPCELVEYPIFEHKKKLVASQTINRVKEAAKIDKWKSADLAHLINNGNDPTLPQIRSKSTILAQSQELNIEASNLVTDQKVSEVA